MRLTIGELRRIIREQVGRMYTIDNAGFGGMGGVSRLMRHKEVPPPGLGDEEEQQTKESNGKEEQEDIKRTAG